MERAQYEQIAVGAGLLAFVAAIASGRLPRWLRVLLVFGLVALASGFALLAYRYTTTPATLTVAAGSMDGDAPKLLSAIAARLVADNATVRLKVVDKGTVTEAAKAFAAGEVDLAVVRGDLENSPNARAVVQLTNAVVLLIGLPGSNVDSVESLKGKRVGVVGGVINQRVVAAISKEYDLEQAKVHFTDLALKDLPQALKAKQVQALLVVMPISDKYLAMLRDFLLMNAKSKVTLVPIEAAGAIAAVSPIYESYDLPKGTLRGSPATPDDDLTTLRVPIYLVANRKIDDDVITALTKATMNSRRALMVEYPLLAQISEPSTDKDALIPIHPGAGAFFDGDQKTIFDKYGDAFFYGSMVVGTATSVVAALWKYMSKGATDGPGSHPLQRLYGLAGRIRASRDEAELGDIEKSIDDILAEELHGFIDGGESENAAKLQLVIQRLEHLIDQRRSTLRLSAQG